jgi:adenylyltransferase/sulfurtransferase
MPDLSETELDRYARHLSIPGVGEAGQEKLKRASVLLIGSGGLGSPAAMYLAAAGVGRLGLVDFDRVERSNLQRQILHGEAAVGRPKIASALERLRDLNPHVELVPHETRFGPDNAEALVADYDLVLDGSDNFPTRFLSNDACYFAGKPLVYGSIFRFEGQVAVFAPRRGGPCYRCMLPELPPPGAAPSCAEAGVIGVLPGVIGSLQAMEAIKWLLELGESPLGKILCYEGLKSRFRTLELPKNPNCALCGDTPTLHTVRNAETLAAAPCEAASISVAELAKRMRQSSEIRIIDVRQPEEHAAAAIPGSRLIPLKELPGRLDEIPSEGPVYVHCKSGKRSAEAVAFLHRNGRPNSLDVIGGIDAWLKLQEASAWS